MSVCTFSEHCHHDLLRGETLAFSLTGKGMVRHAGLKLFSPQEKMILGNAAAIYSRVELFVERQIKKDRDRMSDGDLSY